jgi:hypothetical protein
MIDRVLRVAAVAMLACLSAIGAWAWWRTHDPASPWAFTVEVAGTIDHYADGTVVVSTSTRGRQPVHVGPETVVTTPDGPADVTALWPSRVVVARGDVPPGGGPPVARTIFVLGPGQ